MFRLSAFVLAAIAMVSLSLISADAQAGNSQHRRVHKHQTHNKVVKHRNFRMRSINADSHHNGSQRLANGRKRFNRSTLSFRVADRNHWHRYDRYRYDRYHHNDGHRHRPRVRVNTGAVVVINVVGNRGYRMPVNGTRDANTYSGDVDVYSVPGVGTYSYGDAVYNTGGADIAASTPTSSVKIIDVGDVKPNNGCDMQAGVCVIRP